jgi:hypothetical protein
MTRSAFAAAAALVLACGLGLSAAASQASTSQASTSQASTSQASTSQAGRPESAASSRTAWRVSATFGPKTGTTVIGSISAASGADAWAAGTSTVHAKQSALIEHWTGRSWQRLKLSTATAAGLTNYVPGLSVLAASSSSSDLWEFRTAAQAGFAHYNGKRWSFGSLPAPKVSAGTTVAEVLMASGVVVSRTDAWALGSVLTTSGSVLPYAAHYDGRRWTTTPVPGAGVAVAVTAVSARDVLVLLGTDEFVGFGTGKPTVVSWNGSRWRPLSKQPAVLPGIENATSLAVSGGRVWIGGDYSAGIVNGELHFADFAAELTRSGWRTADLPGASSIEYELDSLVPDGHGGLWGLGTCRNNCFNNQNRRLSQRLWHFTGGRWLAPAAPKFGGAAGELESLAVVPGTSTIWGAGVLWRNGSSAVGLIALAGPAPR